MDPVPWGHSDSGSAPAEVDSWGSVLKLTGSLDNGSSLLGFYSLIWFKMGLYCFLKLYLVQYFFLWFDNDNNWIAMG